MAARCSLDTYVGSYEETVVIACNGQGIAYSRFLTKTLLSLETSYPNECHFDPPPELLDCADALYWDFLGRCDLSALKALRLAESETDEKLNNLQERVDRLSGQTHWVIAHLRRRLRMETLTSDERISLKSRIAKLQEGMERTAYQTMEQSRELRAQLESLTNDTLDSITIDGEMEVLWTVHWRTRTGRRMFELKLPLQEELRPNPQIDVNSEVAKRAAQAVNQDLAKQFAKAKTTEISKRLQPHKATISATATPKPLAKKATAKRCRETPRKKPLRHEEARSRHQDKLRKALWQKWRDQLKTSEDDGS